MAGTSASSYHWARKRSHFTLQVGDDLSDNWNRLFRQTLADWNKNDTVTLEKAGGRTNPEKCQPVTGRVEVCNWRYGTQTGWLGLTQLYFDRSGHIEAATLQLNDSYLNAGKQYNTDAARRHTICHELGHTMGLDHVDTKSCMNNSQYAVFNNVQPIRSDFRQLAGSYDHRSDETTVSGGWVSSESALAPASLAVN